MSGCKYPHLPKPCSSSLAYFLNAQMAKFELFGVDGRDTGFRGSMRNMFMGPPSKEYQDEMMRPTVMERIENSVQTALDLSQSYKGKHCIVTGASGAVGSEVAKILLDAGAKVVLFARDADSFKSLSRHGGKKGHNLFTYAIDFSLHPLDLESKFREAMKDLKGILHKVFVCHGLTVPGSLKTLNLKHWDRCMNINVRSTFMVVSLAVPFLKLMKDENPSVCIVSGESGMTPYLGFTAFSVAKAMINSFIECAALELAYHNIRVNGVAPGVTTKNFADASGANVKKKGVDKTLYISESQIPYTMHPVLRAEMGSVADPKVTEASEIADTVCWLNSDEASYVTGEITKVDAGYSLTTANFGEYAKEFLTVKQPKAGQEQEQFFGN